MNAALYQHQLSAERGVGGTPIGGYARPTVGAHKFQSRRMRDLPPHRQLGRSSRPGHFLSVGWSGSLDEVADFRRLRAAGLKAEQVAAIVGSGR